MYDHVNVINFTWNKKSHEDFSKVIKIKKKKKLVKKEDVVT